jgi:hypothetical protein
MENKKQSSIEWFNQQIIDRQNGEGDSRNWDMILQQAKEKHKQEIMDAFNVGLFHGGKLISTGEHYYRETFKNQEDEKTAD